jgi:acetylornithine aminotransferase/acetylornithine/N-succinyldiaminopimelate aminotransferase
VEHSFHGRTFGSLSVTFPKKYRQPYAPLLAGARFVRFNDVEDLRRKFDSRVAAIILEPIQGESGVRPLSAEFYRAARRLATKHGALLIADEIQCGLSRTGRHFAFQRLGSRPDVITVAKPLAGGLPLGAFIASEKVARVFSPGFHGTTFGGGPLACAVATEVLRIVRRPKMLRHIRRMGALVRKGLHEIQRRSSFVKEVRGAGLMLAMELDRPGEKIVGRARDLGLLINCAHEKSLRFLPPYIIEPTHIEEFLDKLARALVQ